MDFCHCKSDPLTSKVHIKNYKKIDRVLNVNALALWTCCCIEKSKNEKNEFEILNLNLYILNYSIQIYFYNLSLCKWIEISSL